MFELRNKKISELIVKKIKDLGIKKEIKIMEVCGTHTQTVAAFGLKNLLPKNIKVIPGPGCPVCVTSACEFDTAVELALRERVILTTFGDPYRVPGTFFSLDDAKGKGGDVRIVYGANESLEIAKSNPKKEVVHFAIGFETTAPSTAVEIIENEELENFSIICSHRLIPPAMESLLKKGESKIDGFICPGHVSTIIGSKPYKPLVKRFKKPCVIAGFEPNDVLLAVLMILRQLKSGESKVEIEYKRSVRPEGNPIALEKMYKVFEVCEKSWRGIGSIPNSGLRLRKKYKKFDAEEKFEVRIENFVDTKPGCKCGEVMKGLAEPKDCPYFNRSCTPDHPLGACIVSVEGPCNVAYRYG